MKAVCSLMFAVGLLAADDATGQRASAVHKGREAAVAWLDLVDSGQYGASWDQAARSLQAATSRSQWEASIRTQRAPLGAVVARRIKWADYTESLPTPAYGQVVVFEFETRFEHRASVTERVTPVLEADGVWRVAAYQLR